MSQPLPTTIWSAFPTLDRGDTSLLNTLNNCRLATWDAGISLVRQGGNCLAAPLVIAGRLAVTKHSDTGRSLLLYGIESGECCPLTTVTLLSGEVFPAEVTTDVQTTALMVPPTTFLELVGRSVTFRHLVFGQFGRRLGTVIELVESVAFRRLEERLEQVVAQQGPGWQQLTHQALADRLGTSREVVSRILKSWEGQGRVVLHRGALEWTGL